MTQSCEICTVECTQVSYVMDRSLIDSLSVWLLFNKLNCLFYSDVIALIRMPRHNFKMSLEIAINNSVQPCVMKSAFTTTHTCEIILQSNQNDTESGKNSESETKNTETIDPNVTRPWASSIIIIIRTIFIISLFFWGRFIVTLMFLLLFIVIDCPNVYFIFDINCLLVLLPYPSHSGEQKKGTAENHI